MCENAHPHTFLRNFASHQIPYSMPALGKILIIDDNEDVLFALHLLLEPYAEKVKVMRSPDRIVHFITDFRPDIVLLDMNFTRDTVSGQEGMDCLQEILKLDRHAVVVMMTAYADTDKAVQAIKAGATDFVSKPWENDKLLATLRNLRDLGNTLIVVEHDEDTMRAADYLIDIGPGAGAGGGRVVAAGTPEEVMANPDSLTGQYLSGKRSIPVPSARRKGNGHSLIVYGAAEHNLKNIDVSIPLGTFTCVTGVSGSGKSSLVNEILYKKLGVELNRMKAHPGKHRKIQGMEYLDKVVGIDQSPIGRTPRSNPATYTNLFNEIRNLFASTQEAKARGYGPGRFSFNTKGGRCEACCGDGLLKIEMHFLSDVYVPCEVCHGKRYNRETLEVRYKGKNISEVLDMTVEEALPFFAALPKIAEKLQTLMDVGLGYVKLGQSSTTLSGGEAQRVKLATELSRRSTGNTFYILDEPTTGLHAEDVKKLLEVLQRLVDGGNTVLVIEHNLDVIKSADWIIDLGPEGGVGGGEIVAVGTPEEVARCEASYTGQYLKRVLEK